MNSRILLTGANRGIGSAIANTLIESGERVAALGRTPAAIKGLHEVHCDLRRPFDIDAAVDEALEWLGGLDVCILNAAVRRFNRIEKMSNSDWQESLDVNLTSPFVIARRVLPLLIESRGLMLVMGSQASDYQFEAGAAYCATKSALKSFAEVLMMEARPKGVRVTLVTPGAVSNRPKHNDSWKITPSQLAAIVYDIISLPNHLFVSEIEVRPTGIPESDINGLERMHRI